MMDERPRILVVDDDVTARIMMRAALTKAGFDVVLAAHGAEALHSFRRDPADMVMLDVDMPELDGYEVCRLLRDAAGELLPIVMVTGMDDLASVERSYESGATDFISKPINWGLIGHRVRYLLRGQQIKLDLLAEQARNAAILDALPDLLFELDIDGRYIDYHSPRSELLATPAELFLGRTVAEVLPPDAARVCMEALQSALQLGRSSGGQFLLELEQGPCWFELSVARKLAPAGAKPRFIVLSRDITERKRAEERMARLAFIDSLTGLPNRQAFLDRVDREIRRAAQGPGTLAVLFMDLDGFKNVNDTLGHAAGDLILQAAADRLSVGLRPTDLVSRSGGQDADAGLARLGGDEFTALLLDVERPHDVLVVADRLSRLMREPFRVAGHTVVLSASIGFALYPQHGTDGATLLRHADAAMYEVKKVGRDPAAG